MSLRLPSSLIKDVFWMSSKRPAGPCQQVTLDMIDSTHVQTGAAALVVDD